MKIQIKIRMINIMPTAMPNHSVEFNPPDSCAEAAANAAVGAGTKRIASANTSLFIIFL
jgi:hypothetical protein